MNAPTLSELAAAVREMRAAQREYFRTRDHVRALPESKRLERDVDRMVEAALSPQQDMLGEAQG